MELVKYNAAKRALAEAKAIDEVKQLHDVSAAMKAYAVQANDKQLEIDASEIRIRAERRLGEMIREQKESVGLQAGARGIGKPKSGVPEEYPTIPTLADAGISKKLSSRSQAIASIPEDDFEATLYEHREEQQAVTARTMERLANRAHVANNSGNNEWYTPSKYIESARIVMGNIDVDPASSRIANATVRADTFYTAEDNGLSHDWNGRVWMNPPYAQPLISEFCSRLVAQYIDEIITQACVLVNNATETGWFQEMLREARAVCFPKGRVRFIDPEGNPSGAPLQGQAVLYFGENVEAFESEFSQFGTVLKR